MPIPGGWFKKKGGILERSAKRTHRSFLFQTEEIVKAGRLGEWGKHKGVKEAKDTAAQSWYRETRCHKNKPEDQEKEGAFINSGGMGRGVTKNAAW